jgi:hypothetical protein
VIGGDGKAEVDLKTCFALLDRYTKDDPLERANIEILIYQQSCFHMSL